MSKSIHQALVVLTLAVLAPVDGHAQREPGLEYAVKIVCGQAERPAVAPGTYFTAINIHNPGRDTVGFRYKVATTLPNAEPGLISPFAEARLRPDQALEIDCEDARELARQRQFLKGFVVLQSHSPLDVVAVYTAAGESRYVEAMHMERVRPRRLSPSGCPDLVVEQVQTPEWDDVNRRSVIHATIRNIGTAPAPATVARLVDPSTPQSSGAPFIAVANTPPLDPGQAVSVTFFLPYWVYNPDATVEVTADYTNDLAECQEENNTRLFEDIG